jgi:2-polyprenyl-3-methyl-5-hydroxy-6-metoxy-1,4-benzoquinol methylase
MVNKQSNSTRKYLIDGKYLTFNQVSQLLKKQKGVNLRQTKCLEYVEGKKVIDIGCYLGGFCKELKVKKPDAEVYGIDYFEDHIELAKILNRGVDIHFDVMSVYSMKYPDSYFDCVTFQEIIEHLSNPNDALREINRVLKPEGILVISTNNVYYLAYLVSSVRQEYVGIIKHILKRNYRPSPVVYSQNVEWHRHIFCWNLPTLYTLLKENGFEYLEHCFEGGFRHKLSRFFFETFAPYLCNTMILKLKKVAEPKKII